MVNQEKKPGTKPEESTEGTLAVQNGIIAETIEDKSLFPVSVLANDLHQEADDGAEAVLVVMAGQKDLGSEALESLMAKPLSEEEIPAVGDSEIRQAEVLAEKDNETCKTVVPVLGDDDVIKDEGPVVQEMKANRPTVDIEPVYVKVPAVEEQPSAFRVGASPDFANTVVEPVVADTQKTVAGVPDEVPPSLETATENSPLLPPLVRPKSPASTEATNNEVEPPAGPMPCDASVEDHITPRSSEEKENIIDAGIAVATIPEMFPLVPVTYEAQAEYTFAVEESNESLLMPSETVQQIEPSCPAELTSCQEPALVLLEVPVSSKFILKTSSEEVSEIPPSLGDSSSSVVIDCAVEVPVVRATQKEIEANSPVPATEQVSEPSTEVVFEAECHHDMEKEKSKKQD
ncbi:uncharacterized protein LOC133500998 isoform X2 [Syngnathoides biaculeatus]|nr:uncharacterized protein LOC133500998 isoform X2 [Syngnathoides biaculeatus]